MITLSKRLTLFVLIIVSVCAHALQPSATTDLERFETAGVFSEAEVDSAIATGKLAKQPETALVPLFFDHDGYLLNAESYNRLIGEGKLEQTIATTTYTDLSTYKSVMEEKAHLGLNHQALEDIDAKYAVAMGGPFYGSTDRDASAQVEAAANAEDLYVYIYDAYSKFYQTTEEAMQEIDEMIREQASQELQEPSPADDAPVDPDAIDLGAPEGLEEPDSEGN